MRCEILDGPNGNVIGVVEGDKRWAEANYQFYRLIPDPVPPVARVISKLALINRFTDAEWTSLDLESIDIPAEGIVARRARARLRRFLLKITNAQKIHLDHPEWITALQALESAGRLAVGRADEILNTDPTPDEMP